MTGVRTSEVPARRFVCVHGIGGAASDWAGVTTGLARAGDVTCLEVPPGSLASGRDVIVRELTRGMAGTVLVGHSRGGVLALLAAALRPDQVIGVVLAGGYVPPSRAGRPWLIGAGSWLKHRGRLAGRFLRQGHLTARQIDRTSSVRASLPAVLQMAGVGLRPASFDALARTVKCPVLAIAGDRDSHVPASWVRAAAQRYGWSFALIPGGGHFAHVDQCDRWTDAVEQWLTE